MTPVCDYLTVSVPTGDSIGLRTDLTELSLRIPDSHMVDDGVRVDHGMLYFASYGSFSVVSASGTMLAALRAHSLFADYLSIIGACGPHRITRLDAALDFQCDVPAAIEAFKEQLTSQGCKLTRKRIRHQDCVAILSRNDVGKLTGSIMVGHRKRHETTACIYDRQHDARQKGKPDPGPLLRIEVRTGMPGLTLRDAYQPWPLFHHLAAPDLIGYDPDAPEWVPFDGGYTLEPRTALTPREKLDRICERSSDVALLLELAQSFPGGVDALCLQLRRRANLMENSKTLMRHCQPTCDSAEPPAATRTDVH